MHLMSKHVYFIMKKIFIYFLVLFTFSCSLDSDYEETFAEIVPVESVIMPTEFVLNEVYEISLTYLRPTTCHAFNDIYFVSESNERTVAVITTVFTSNYPCEDLYTELEASFNFKPINTGSYIFNFWQGEDDNGEDQYLIIEVPVI